ncbi:MAG: EAL domain-containing protein [Proteobacteria bacterium]|nr:EAL domain-containing protein [Pseudomonadota bacterium]
MFTPNLSGIDRMVRLSLGIFMLWLGLVATDLLADGAINITIAIVGIINVFSAVLSHCPIYKMVGISTLKLTSNKEISQLRMRLVTMVASMLIAIIMIFAMASWRMAEESVLKSAIVMHGNAIKRDLKHVVVWASKNVGGEKTLRSFRSEDEEKILRSFQVHDKADRFVIVHNKHGEMVYRTPISPAFKDLFSQLLSYSEQQLADESLIGGNVFASNYLVFDGHYRASVFQVIADNPVTSPFSSKNFIFVVLIGLWASVWFGFNISAMATRSLEKKNAEVIRQTLHDDLTGLPNRILLLDRIQQAAKTALRNNRSVALFVIDLDNFKDVNNAIGHSNGDYALTMVGNRLRETVRDTDTVARLSGDSFAVLMPDTGYDDAGECASKILTVFSKPFSVDFSARRIDIELIPSIGVSLFPDHGAEPDQLVRRAEIAMYRCKHSDIRTSFFQPDDDPVSLQRLSLLAGLREAIELDGLELFYQPKLNAVTQNIVGVEALSRWNHKDNGFVSPDVFIPLAEEAGLIRPLTSWVIDTAVKQCHDWMDQGMAYPVAINLSARNLHDPTLIDVIRDSINRYQVPADLLQFEITEGAMMHDPLAAQKNLRRLHGLGVTLSIDDFGTGFSSLSYLRSIPADELKIDKSFILGMSANRDNYVIVQSTIRMAHNLGKRLVAEGVEDQGSLDNLIEMGCDIVQGYYFCRPVSATDFSRWAHEHNQQLNAAAG